MLDANKLQQAVDQAYTQFHSLNGGQNADYIPFLANVPGQLAAVAIVTCDGNIYRAGDSDYRFALESISKVCTLALALEDVGPQAVQDKIGADPTGLPFNSVIALELHGGKPLSPLVNAGAIATTSLINAENIEQRWQRILHIQQQLAGEQVALSDEVNQSEQTTNFHNRAIAWLLYSAGYLYCVSRWFTGQKRCRWRYSGGRPWRDGNCRVLTTAGRRRQQCSRSKNGGIGR